MAVSVATLAYIDATGYHYADYPTFLQYIQENFRSIYGADIYLGADSQDGQLSALFAQALFDTAALGASVYNSFAPTGAQGVGLSRLVKINGLNRGIPTQSTVTVTVVGQAGTTITNGIAVDILNQQWALPTSVLIPGPGTIDVTATAVEPGAVAAAIGTITGIFTPTLGWQSVTNAAAATEGAPVETDAELRARQIVSVANPSLTVLEGTLGAILNVTGVQAAKIYENATGATDINGVPAHSFAPVVSGGDITEISQAIADHKTPGTGTYGTTTTTVYDDHGMPLAISFFEPDPAQIGVEVTITAGVGWSTEYEAQIAARISDAITSGGQNNPYPSNGGIGETVYLTPLYIAAYLPGAPGQTYTVAAIRLKKNAGSFGTANISLLFNEIPTCDPSTDVVFIP